MALKAHDENKGALETVERIARQHLGFETLAARDTDGLDFREVAVWQAREALLAAYEAGRAASVSSSHTPARD